MKHPNSNNGQNNDVVSFYAIGFYVVVHRRDARTKAIYKQAKSNAFKLFG